MHENMIPFLISYLEVQHQSGANVAEGKSGSSKNDFLKFQIIALKSANETKYWLRLIKESLAVNEKKFDDLINEIDEISKVLATIIIKNKNSDL